MIKISKKFILSILLIFFYLVVVNANENKIVVKVDKKIISSYEIKNKINTFLILRNLEINQSNINKIKDLVVQDLINYRIKENEISKYDTINIEEMDISNQLKSISSNNIQEFKRKFLMNNLNYEAFIQELKTQAAWQRLIFLLFKNKVKINEDEILNEIENVKSSTSVSEEYDLSELELSFTNQDEKKNKIKEVQKKIIDIGFDKTVSIYSESETAIKNGRVGFINKNSLSKEFVDKLKNLKEGDISEPIVRLNKIIFLKINEIRVLKNDNVDINLLKKNIIDNKKNELFNLYSKSHLSKLKSNSYIEFK